MTTVNDPKGEAGSKKAPMWLLPPVALEQTAWVAKLGAEKYGPYNWRKTGVCATTYVSAIMRHLNAWRDGEDLDPESGISHIAHIATSCNILMDAAACGTLQDDRNKRPTTPSRAAELLEESGRDMPSRLGDHVKLSRSPWIDLINKTSDFTGIVESTSGTGVMIDGKFVEYPPVPEGYDRWEYRGFAWDPGRSARFQFLDACGWSEYEDPGVPLGAQWHYIEAVKRPPVLTIGNPVSVNPMYEPAFRSVVEKVAETRDGLLYTFANGLTYSDNEIFSITPISSTPASDTDEQP